jgi:hypothetical protein
LAGLERIYVAGDKPVQKATSVLARYFDHAAIREQGCLHGSNRPSWLAQGARGIPTIERIGSCPQVSS